MADASPIQDHPHNVARGPILWGPGHQVFQYTGSGQREIYLGFLISTDIVFVVCHGVINCGMLPLLNGK